MLRIIVIVYCEISAITWRKSIIALNRTLAFYMIVKEKRRLVYPQFAILKPTFRHLVQSFRLAVYRREMSGLRLDHAVRSISASLEEQTGRLIIRRRGAIVCKIPARSSHPESRRHFHRRRRRRRRCSIQWHRSILLAAAQNLHTRT